jgi:hypothetical protein
VDDAPFELDDEQHVITAEQNGVDREEISGQEAFGLGAEELAVSSGSEGLPTRWG